jgi:hypothetical protein
MHKKGFFFFAKKWTNIGPNQESTTKFFSRTQNTLSKNQEKTSHEAIIAKLRNGHFLPLKHAFFIQKKIIISYTNMFQSKKLKKKIKTLKSNMRYQIQKLTT